jgi:hypothetical protein
MANFTINQDATNIVGNVVLDSVSSGEEVSLPNNDYPNSWLYFSVAGAVLGLAGLVVLYEGFDHQQ